MKGRLIIFIMILLAGMLPMTGNNLISRGDSAYNEKNYNEAISLYEEAAETSGVSAPLLFNLGNAYFEAGDMGYAMLCYQRAKRLDPTNKYINSNLNYLTEKINDANKALQKGKRRKVTEDEANFFQNMHKKISEDSSSDMWAGWAAAFFLIFAGAVALYLYGGSVIVKKTGFFGGLVFLSLSLVFLVIAYIGASSYDNHEYGIITAYKVNLLTEPNEVTDTEEDLLSRGTKIRIVAEETNAEGEVTWYKVRLNSDYIGWLKAEDLEVI